MWIQFIISFLACIALLRIVQNYRAHRLSGASSLLWCLVWLSVAVVFWSPDITSRLALMVGIGRGADLVTYGAIIVLIYLVYRVFMRLEKLEHTITQLTRAVTLRDASHKDSSTDTHSES